jgi:group I intron endonuclease
MRVIIYTLTDPRDNLIKYIGKAKSINTRLYTHMVNCNLKKNTKKTAWLKSLKSQGLVPIIEELDTVGYENWKETEKYWIAQFKAWGFNLKNLTSGGDGNDSPRTEEFKKRVSETMTGRPANYIMTQDIKDKMSVAAKRPENVKKLIERSKLTKDKAAERCWKPVIELTKDGKIITEYPSLKHAAESVNGDNSSISKVCRGKAQTAYGKIWKYKY